MESSSLACTSERGTKIWTRACNPPVPRRFFFVWPQSALKPASWAFISMQTRGVGLKNTYKIELSTLAWHVSRRLEEKRTSFNQSIPRRFSSLASRHSTSGFFACKTQISPSVCINGLPNHKMESSDIACAPERGAKMWIRECNLPVPRRFSCLATKRTQACFRGFFQCKWEGWA